MRENNIMSILKTVLKNNKQPRVDDYDDEDGEMGVGMMMQQPKFIEILDTPSRLEVHLRGVFCSPMYVSKEIAYLYQMNKKHDTVAVFINSVGGDASLLSELVSVFRTYKSVITIAGGNLASAGFMMFGIGDVRVVQDHTWMMAHRESYAAPPNKTENHLDLANYNKELYGNLLADTCGDILTDEEIERATRTEVYVTADQLIDRGVAISWADFIQAEQREIEPRNIVSVDGIPFLYDEEEHTMTMIENIELGETFPVHDVIYHMEFVGEDEMEEMLKEILDEEGEEEHTTQTEGSNEGCVGCGNCNCKTEKDSTGGSQVLSDPS